MIDYFFKTALPVHEEWPLSEEWDVFIAALDGSDRVRHVYHRARARRKRWLVLPEYPADALNLTTMDRAERVDVSTVDAIDFAQCFQHLLADSSGGRICVDISGFVHTYVLLLVALLVRWGFRRFDMIYAEPMRYSRAEKTDFTPGEVLRVGTVPGYQGVHPPDCRNDLLIIGTGYDQASAAQVARHKERCRKIQLFGLPSLRADMYQQSRLNALELDDDTEICFAPANDPFATARVLRETVGRENRLRSVTNLYLAPLSTKAQALGFALYYVAECRGKAASVVYPFCSRKGTDTARGISRIWKYTIEL